MQRRSPRISNAQPKQVTTEEEEKHAARLSHFNDMSQASINNLNRENLREYLRLRSAPGRVGGRWLYRKTMQELWNLHLELDVEEQLERDDGVPVEKHEAAAEALRETETALNKLNDKNLAYYSDNKLRLEDLPQRDGLQFKKYLSNCHLSGDGMYSHKGLKQCHWSSKEATWTQFSRHFPLLIVHSNAEFSQQNLNF